MRRRLVENILYYLSGFLVVSLFLVIAFILALGRLDEGVRRQAELGLDGGISRLEDLETRMRMLNNVITQDSSFSTLFYQGEGSASTIAALRSLDSLYQNLAIIAQAPSYIFTLFKDSPVYISSADSSLDVDDYFSKFMTLSVDGRQIEDAADLWDLLASSFAQGRDHIRLDYISFPSAGGDLRLEDPILVIQSAGGQNRDPQFITACLMPRDEIVEIILGDVLTTGAIVRIADEATGEVLVDTGDGLPLEDSDYHVIHGSSALLDYSIILAIPTSYFSGQLSPVVTLLSSVILAGITSALVFAMVYALTHYRSVRTIITSIDEDSSGRRLHGDFADIQQRVMRLRKEGESYKAEAGELQRQNQAVQFQNILTQGIRNQEDRELADRLVPFISRGCIVALVRVIRGDRQLWYEDRLYAYLADSPFPEGLIVPSGSNDAALILPCDESEGAQDAIAHSLERLFQLDGRSILHIGLSQTGNEVDELATLRDEAARALDSLYMYDNGNAYIFYGDEKRTSLLESFSIEALSRLKNLLLRTSREEATAMLYDLFSKAAGHPLEAEERKEEIWYSLCTTFQTVFLTLGTKGLETGRFHSGLTMDQMRDHFIGLTRQLCDMVHSNLKSHNKELLDAIIKTIDESWQNQGTSAYTVSRAVGISEKYLVSFFREQMGMSFPQYLLVLRLTKAKALLESSGESNERIASMTGFGSLNTFYRNFSKYYGLSPKAYRDGLRK